MHRHILYLVDFGCNLDISGLAAELFFSVRPLWWRIEPRPRKGAFEPKTNIPTQSPSWSVFGQKTGINKDGCRHQKQRLLLLMPH